jgi:hypothetical protein
MLQRPGGIRGNTLVQAQHQRRWLLPVQADQPPVLEVLEDHASGVDLEVDERPDLATGRHGQQVQGRPGRIEQILRQGRSPLVTQPVGPPGEQVVVVAQDPGPRSVDRDGPVVAFLPALEVSGGPDDRVEPMTGLRTVLSDQPALGTEAFYIYAQNINAKTISHDEVCSLYTPDNSGTFLTIVDTNNETPTGEDTVCGLAVAAFKGLGPR